MPKQSIKLSLKEKDVAKIEKTIDDAVASYIEDLPGRLRTIMDKIVLGALGFSEAWGRIEVDHCNGREPFVAKLLNEQAKKLCEEAMAKHHLTLTPEFEEALRKDYGERLQRHFDNWYDRKVNEHFESLFKTLLDESELKLDLKVDVPNNKDLVNPSLLSKTPKLRDLILRSVVESDGKETKTDARPYK